MGFLFGGSVFIYYHRSCILKKESKEDLAIVPQRQTGKRSSLADLGMSVQQTNHPFSIASLQPPDLETAPPLEVEEDAPCAAGLLALPRNTPLGTLLESVQEEEAPESEILPPEGPADIPKKKESTTPNEDTLGTSQKKNLASQKEKEDDTHSKQPIESSQRKTQASQQEEEYDTQSEQPIESNHNKNIASRKEKEDDMQRKQPIESNQKKKQASCKEKEDDTQSKPPIESNQKNKQASRKEKEDEPQRKQPIEGNQNNEQTLQTEKEDDTQI